MNTINCVARLTKVLINNGYHRIVSWQGQFGGINTTIFENANGNQVKIIHYLETDDIEWKFTPFSEIGSTDRELQEAHQ